MRVHLAERGSCGNSPETPHSGHRGASARSSACLIYSKCNINDCVSVCRVLYFPVLTWRLCYGEHTHTLTACTLGQSPHEAAQQKDCVVLQQLPTLIQTDWVSSPVKAGSRRPLPGRQTHTWLHKQGRTHTATVNSSCQHHCGHDSNTDSFRERDQIDPENLVIFITMKITRSEGRVRVRRSDEAGSNIPAPSQSSTLTHLS